MIRTCLVGAAVAVASVFSLAPASAHEFIVKPSAASVKAGDSVAATVLSTHVFLKSEEIEPADITSACLFADGKRTPIALTADQAKLAYTGSASAPTDKTFILCGVRGAVNFATLPEGGKRGTRRDFPNAKLVRSIEKFSKAIVNASADDQTWSKPIGDRLEIMLKVNPAGIKVGDDVPVQVLFEGKPIPTRLYATYDGFTNRPMSFAFYHEMEGTDTGHVKITAPGTWIIRAEHAEEVKTPEIDRYVARAVLLLDVK